MDAPEEGCLRPYYKSGSVFGDAQGAIFVASRTLVAWPSLAVGETWPTFVASRTLVASQSLTMGETWSTIVESIHGRMLRLSSNPDLYYRGAD